jgi:zinc transporter, ZIP family
LSSPQPGKVATLGRVLIPLLLLGALIYAFAARGDQLTKPIRGGASEIPLAESITFERIEFKPSQIVAHVRNSGPKEITIAQIHLNDMTVEAFMAPGKTIPRLGLATITIPHDWVEADPYEVRLVSAAGLFHAETVDAAAMTPTPDARYLAVFGLLGVYVGVVPLYLGLAWFPFLRRLGEGSMRFLTAFTVGLLVFLGLDAVLEAFEAQEKVAAPYKPGILIVAGIVVSFLALSTVGAWLTRAGATKGVGFVQLGLSYMIAIGIGLHNLGEGLAIGAAYSIGAVGLGATLIIGFTIHNTTEGIAVVAPITRTGASLKHLIVLGFIAGAPTIIGTWIGGFASSHLWSLIFLSVGAGAIFQVVYVIVKQMGEDSLAKLSTKAGFCGIAAGLAVMYVTSLMVAK